MQLHWFWFYVNSFLIGSKNMMSIIIIIIVVPLPITSEVLFPGGGGREYCHIWAIQVCAAVKGMVFKQFTLA